MSIYVDGKKFAGFGGRQGVQGEVGPRGPAGPQGEQGPPGKDGQGVPPGGTTGQVLSKASDTDGDVAWADPSGGVTMEQVTAAIQAAVLDSWEGSY